MTWRTAERELEALRRHEERVEGMMRDRDAVVLEHYAALAPEALDSLTSEERHQLYTMLRLKVWVAKGGELEIKMAGVPADGLDVGSSTWEVTSIQTPSFRRTPGLKFRVLLIENGAERVELARA